MVYSDKDSQAQDTQAAQRSWREYRRFLLALRQVAEARLGSTGELAGRGGSDSGGDPGAR